MKDAILENVQLAFRNFSGTAGRYNREGDRNTMLVLPEDVAMELHEAGWNIKMKTYEESGETVYRIKAKVNFNSRRPPKIVAVSAQTGKQLILDANNIGILDSLDVISVDVILSPYQWNIENMRGITAYVKTMYALYEEDPFQSKYDTEEN